MAKDVYIGHVMMSDCAVFLACKKLILNTQNSFALDQLLQTALSYSWYKSQLDIIHVQMARCC